MTNWRVECVICLTLFLIGITMTPALAKKTPPLLIYCAAALKPLIDEAIPQYEKQYGVPVHVQYGASGTLLSNISITKRGDLYLPADESFLVEAKKSKHVDSTHTLVYMTPVLVVHTKNTLGITSFEKFMGTRRATLAFANPETASISRVTRTVLQKSGEWARVEPHITVTLPTVTDVANAVKLRTVDAGIVWDAVARQYPEFTIIRHAPLDQARQQVSVGVLRTSTQPKRTRHFAEFLVSKKMKSVYRKLGYDVGRG